MVKIENNIPLSGVSVKGDIYNKTRNNFRKSRIDAGLCRDCGTCPPLINSKVCQSCKDKRTLNSTNHKKNRIASGLCTLCGASHSRGKFLCDLCSEKQILKLREVRKRNKITIVEYFGGKCVQCGESDIRAMSLDHIDNDGHIDCKGKNGKRIQSSVWYARLYKKLLNGTLSSERLQLLCFNCHAKKDLNLWWHDET